MSIEVIGRGTFVHRVLRWLAVIGMFYAVLRLVGDAVQLSQDNLRAWWLGFPGLRATERVLYVAAGLADVSLLVGAWGLMRWKRWGRTLMLWWPPTTVVVQLAAALCVVILIQRALAATTQPSVNFGQYIWSMFSFWMRDSVFPLIVFVILRQPEVAALWSAAPASGFEVIPLAKRAES